jgi:NAD(P)-dependent dehydrogenase (short-subunit alcohol dehydrogenase family)
MQNVIITGGSSGIGLNIIKLLSATNKFKIYTGARRDLLKQVDREQVKNVAGYAMMNLGCIDDVIAFNNDVVLKVAPVMDDVLILNAGISGIETIDGMPDEFYSSKNGFQYLVNTNLESAKIILLAWLFTRSQKGTYGKVIFLSSSTVEIQDPDPLIKPYILTKLSMENFMEQCSNAPYGFFGYNISFFTVRPGQVDTRIQQNILNLKEGRLYERTRQGYKEGLVKSTEEVAQHILKLIEETYPPGFYISKI